MPLHTNENVPNEEDCACQVSVRVGKTRNCQSLLYGLSVCLSENRNMLPECRAALLGSSVASQQDFPPELNILWTTGWQRLQMFRLPRDPGVHSSCLRWRTGIPRTRPPSRCVKNSHHRLSQPPLPAAGSHPTLPRSRTSCQEVPEHLLPKTCGFFPSDQLCGLFDQFIDFWPRAQKYLY